MVFELIRDLLADSLVCDAEQITMQSDLQEDLELTGSDLAEVVETLAAELSFSWRHQDLEDITTVSELVRYVERQV